MADYEIGATMPIEVGKGKMEKGKDNTQVVIDSPKKRNLEFGYLEIPAVENKKVKRSRAKEDSKEDR